MVQIEIVMRKTDNTGYNVGVVHVALSLLGCLVTPIVTMTA